MQDFFLQKNVSCRMSFYVSMCSSSYCGNISVIDIVHNVIITDHLKLPSYYNTLCEFPLTQANNAALHQKTAKCSKAFLKQKGVCMSQLKIRIYSSFRDSKPSMQISALCSWAGFSFTTACLQHKYSLILYNHLFQTTSSSFSHIVHNLCMETIASMIYVER